MPLKQAIKDWYVRTRPQREADTAKRNAALPPTYGQTSVADPQGTNHKRRGK